MKALMGSLAQKILKDPKGSKEMKQFMLNSSKDSQEITLKNGKKYRISRNNQEEQKISA